MQAVESSIKAGKKLVTHSGAWEYPDSAVRDTRKYAVAFAELLEAALTASRSLPLLHVCMADPAGFPEDVSNGAYCLKSFTQEFSGLVLQACTLT